MSSLFLFIHFLNLGLECRGFYFAPVLQWECTSLWVWSGKLKEKSRTICLCFRLLTFRITSLIGPKGIHEMKNL